MPIVTVDSKATGMQAMHRRQQDHKNTLIENLPFCQHFPVYNNYTSINIIQNTNACMPDMSLYSSLQRCSSSFSAVKFSFKTPSFDL